MSMLSTAASTLWSGIERKKMVLLHYIYGILIPFLRAQVEPVHPHCFSIYLHLEPSCSQAIKCPLRKQCIFQNCRLHSPPCSALNHCLTNSLILCNLNSPLKHLICTHLKPSAKDSEAQHAQMLNFRRLSQHIWPLGIRSCTGTCQQLLCCVSTWRWPANVNWRVLTWIMCV